MLNGNTTNPFHVFTLIRGDIPCALVAALEEAHRGNEAQLARLLSSDSALAAIFEKENCSFSAGRKGCKKSDSTLLFIGLTALDESGERMRIDDNQQTRERLGRYDTEDGNALNYLLMWSGDSDSTTQTGEDGFLTLIEKLNSRLSAEGRGHSRFSQGDFHDLQGYLTEGECVSLDSMLRKGQFKVLADEPLDGGVADIVRQLKIVVRCAARNGLGLLHYTH